MTFQERQTGIADAIRWELVSEEICASYQRGLLWASEVAAACPQSVSRYVLTIAKRVNRAMALGIK